MENTRWLVGGQGAQGPEQTVFWVTGQAATCPAVPVEEGAPLPGTSARARVSSGRGMLSR